MATYHLSVHDLMERLARESPEREASRKPARRASRSWSSRSDSVSSWFSDSEASEVDFTDYHGRAHEAFEQVVASKPGTGQEGR